MSLAGSSINSPFRVFFVHQRAKNCPSMTKINRGQDSHYLSVCTKSEASIYIVIFKAMNADKWLWPIFGCKVGQSVKIGMKLKLDMWHHPLDVKAKFQTDISQRVQKSPENFSLAGSSSNTPLSSVFFPAKNCPTMTKISREFTGHQWIPRTNGHFDDVIMYCSNTCLSSPQNKQISITFGVWPFFSSG